MVYDAIADYLGAGPEKRWRPPAAAPQGVRIEASSFDVAGFVEAVRLERTSATFKRRYPAAGRETAGDAFEAVRAEAMRNEVVWDFGHGRGHGHGK
jgi:hypothetical protein